MPEVNISCPEDLKKLEGWTIKKAESKIEDDTPMFILSASHPFAEKEIEIVFEPFWTGDMGGYGAKAAIELSAGIKVFTKDR